MSEPSILIKGMSMKARKISTANGVVPPEEK